MITNWLFHISWARRLRQQKDSPHVNKIETDHISAACILEILSATQTAWLSLSALAYRLGIKSIQNTRARTVRDSFKKEMFVPNPVFSEGEISKIRSKFWRYLFYVIFFSIGEAFFYMLIVVLFIPHSTLSMQITCSVFIAVVIMSLLSFGLGKHFKWREAVDRHQRKEISDIHLRSYNDWRLIGYTVLVFTIIAVLFVGFSRIYMLENINVDSLPPTMRESITRASRMASYFTLLFTIGTSVAMAVFKLQFNKIARQYRTYRAWHTALVRRNRYTLTLYNNSSSIPVVAEKLVKKYLQLIVDLKRILLKPFEFDEKYKLLDEEYVTERGQKGFVVTQDVYNNYYPIQVAHPELFAFGVFNDPAIKDKIAFARIVQGIAKEHLDEHNKLPASKHIADMPPISTNGKAKQIFNHI